MRTSYSKVKHEQKFTHWFIHSLFMLKKLRKNLIGTQGYSKVLCVSWREIVLSTKVKDRKMSNIKKGNIHMSMVNNMLGIHNLDRLQFFHHLAFWKPISADMMAAKAYKSAFELECSSSRILEIWLSFETAASRPRLWGEVRLRQALQPPAIQVWKPM